MPKCFARAAGQGPAEGAAQGLGPAGGGSALDSRRRARRMAVEEARQKHQQREAGLPDKVTREMGGSLL